MWAQPVGPRRARGLALRLLSHWLHARRRADAAEYRSSARAALVLGSERSAGHIGQALKVCRAPGWSLPAQQGLRRGAPPPREAGAAATPVL